MTAEWCIPWPAQLNNCFINFTLFQSPQNCAFRICTLLNSQTSRVSDDCRGQLKQLFYQHLNLKFQIPTIYRAPCSCRFHLNSWTSLVICLTDDCMRVRYSLVNCSINFTNLNNPNILTLHIDTELMNQQGNLFNKMTAGWCISWPT